jgi:hypothetical protein
MKYSYCNKLCSVVIILLAVLVLLGLQASPTQAGEPDETIGPMNPEELVCFDNPEGEAYGTSREDEISLDEPWDDIEEQNITAYEAQYNILKEYCEDEGGYIDFLRETRIEGHVYEYHPDINNPGEWFPVPSQDVMVIARGVTFEVFWGTDRDGYYTFLNGFGSGPIILNLGLPADAYALNSNITIESTGEEETWTVDLGFYRGDVAPADVSRLRTPGGNFLPFGSTKYIGIVGSDDVTSMPNVGGQLPSRHSIPTVALSIVLLLALPVAGIRQLLSK